MLMLVFNLTVVKVRQKKWLGRGGLACGRLPTIVKMEVVLICTDPKLAFHLWFFHVIDLCWNAL